MPKKPGDHRDPKSIPEEERYYFLEENHPLFGNLVPRDVASREIYDVVYNKKMGVENEPMVYLDLTHHSREYLDNRLGGIIDIYQKFTRGRSAIDADENFPGSALFDGRVVDRLPG